MRQRARWSALMLLAGSGVSVALDAAEQTARGLDERDLFHRGARARLPKSLMT